jgi:hypothetical protein
MPKVVVQPIYGKANALRGYEVIIPDKNESVFISMEQYLALGEDDSEAIAFAVNWLEENHA